MILAATTKNKVLKEHVTAAFVGDRQNRQKNDCLKQFEELRVVAGSSSTICDPPGPVMISLRNCIPAARSRSTSVAKSSTTKWILFQPPGAGIRPSGIGRPAELVGPLSSNRKSPRRCVGERWSRTGQERKTEVRAVKGNCRLDVVDHVRDIYRGHWCRLLKRSLVIRCRCVRRFSLRRGVRARRPPPTRAAR